MFAAIFCFGLTVITPSIDSTYIGLNNLTAIQSGYRIKLSITNLPEVTGNIAILVFNESEGFPGDEKKAIRKAVLKVTGRVVLHEFEQLPPGQYAVAVIHDRNGNSKLDTNFLGIPSEGVGISNNAMNMFGPPKFQDAVFDLKNSDANLTIRLRN